MLNKFRKELAWKWPEVIVASLLVVMMFSGLSLAILQSGGTQTVSIPTPTTFKTGECFQRNGMREPWEPNGPDGIIMKRGYEHYLAMFHNEAERRGGGAKVTIPWSIKSFDETHHGIACPENWRTHNLTRR